MDNKRFYNFTFIIYEDDENFENQWKVVQEEQSSIWIRHDKDLTEEGELKKPHYHVVFKLKNARTISALAKKLEIGENMIEPVKKSLNGCLKYLIHYGNDDKYQYERNEVKSNDERLLRRFEELVTKNLTEEEKVEDIESFLDTTKDYIDLRIFGKYVRKINRWDAFRRNFSYFKAIIDDHNSRVSYERFGKGNHEYYKDLEHAEEEEEYQLFDPSSYPF